MTVTVVYLDSVFVLNAVMDYLLLLSAARLAGLPLRRSRYVLAALAAHMRRRFFSPAAGFWRKCRSSWRRAFCWG